MGIGGNDMVWSVGGNVDSLLAALAAGKNGLQDFHGVTKADLSSGLVKELVRIETQARIMAGEMTAAQAAAQRFSQAGASSELVGRYEAASAKIAEVVAQKEAAHQAEIAAERERRALQQEMDDAVAFAIAEQRAARAQAADEERQRLAAMRVLQQELDDVAALAIAEQREARAKAAAEAHAQDEARMQANRIHNETEQAKITAWHAQQKRMEEDRQQANRIHNEREQAKIDAYNERKKKAIADQAKLEQSAQQVTLSAMTAKQRLEMELAKLQDLRNRGLISEATLIRAAANARQASLSAARVGAMGGMAGGFPMVAQALAVGIQDVTTVRSMGGSIAQQINAGANNAIFMASLINPLLGMTTALGIAGFQLAQAWSGAADEAKRLKEEAEASRKAAEGTMNAFLSGVSHRPKTEQEAFKEKADIEDKQEALRAELAAAKALKPVTKDDKEIRDKAIRDREQGLNELEIRRQALISKINSKTLPDGVGKSDEAKSFAKQTWDMEKELAVLQGKTTKAAQDRLALRMRFDLSPTQIKERIAVMDLLEKTKLHNDAIREGIELRAETGRTYAQTAGQMAQEGKSIKDSFRTPEEALRDRARELLKMQAAGAINGNDVTRSLSQFYAQQQGAPVLAQGLVRGTAEEVSARNRLNAENEQQKLIASMVDTVTAMERYSSDVRDFTAEAAKFADGFWEDAQFVGVIDK